MDANHNQRSLTRGAITIAGLILVTAPLSAQQGSCPNCAPAVSQRAVSRPVPADPPRDNSSPPPAAPIGAPHGGQIKAGSQHLTEVVYQPQQIQVYLYDTHGRPLSIQGVVGDVAMEVNGNPRQWWYRLEPASAGDHFVVNVDLSRVRDRDMVAIFELKNLPYREEPQVRFAQLFALTQATPRVQVVPLAAGDREAAAQQRVCPVMGGGFDHGAPIKLLVDGRPLFVCCGSCIEEVKKAPENFASSVRLESMRLMHQSTVVPSANKGAPLPNNLVALYGARPGVTVAPVTNADARWIAEQRICPVTKKPLGSMGNPLRVTVEGHTLYVCCQGCVQAIEADPLFYVPPTAAPITNDTAGSCSSKGCSRCQSR